MQLQGRHLAVASMRRALLNLLRKSVQQQPSLMRTGKERMKRAFDRKVEAILGNGPDR